MRYRSRVDGEWIEPAGAFHKIACCDCGLVHLVEFRRQRRGVKFRAWRDVRATARRRKRLALTKS